MDSINLNIFKANIRGLLFEELFLVEQTEPNLINAPRVGKRHRPLYTAEYFSNLNHISSHNNEALRSAFLIYIDRVDGLTYIDKAEEIGISLSTLKNLLRKTYPTCKFDTVIKFALACRLTVQGTVKLLSFAGLAFSIANYRHVCIKQLLAHNYLAYHEMHKRLSHEEINEMLQAVGCDVLY